jgi:hypothetical protein
MGDELTEDWRKVHSNEPQNFHPSQNVISKSIIISRSTK